MQEYVYISIFIYTHFETFRHSRIYLLSTQNCLHHLSRYVFKSIRAGSFPFISSHQVKQKKHTMQDKGLHLSLDGWSIEKGWHDNSCWLWTPKLLHQKYWLGERVYEFLVLASQRHTSNQSWWNKMSHWTPEWLELIQPQSGNYSSKGKPFTFI